MDTFKDRSRSIEKLWLCVILSIFITLMLSSIDNIFLNNNLISINEYIFFILYPILLVLNYYLFIKSERFLDYGFRESFIGYLIIFLLIIIMIFLMLQVEPIVRR